MTYKLTWMVDKRIIYFRTSGVVTIDEIKEANRQIMVMIDEGIQFVHLLTDSTDVDKIVFSLSDLVSAFRGILYVPNLGWSIYVSPKALERFFANVTTQLSQSRHREFGTLDQAIAFLQSVDETLPEIDLSQVKADQSK